MRSNGGMSGGGWFGVEIMTLGEEFTYYLAQPNIVHPGVSLTRHLYSGHASSQLSVHVKGHGHEDTR